MNSWFEIIAGELRAKLLRQLRGLAGQRVNAQSTHQRPDTAGVKGAGGTGGPGCGAHGRRGQARQRGDAPNHTPAHQAPLAWRAPEGPEGQAAVPAGGGGARPGFEATRRAKLAARTARGRAAAHGAARPNNTPRGAQNTSGATRHLGTTKPPSPTGAGRLRQSAGEGQRRITTMSGSPRPLS